MKLSLLSLAASITLAQADIGEIWVVQGSDVQKATPSSRIGCLNADGRFVDSDCGTFSFTGNSVDPLTSPHGKCSFFDTTSEEGRGDAFQLRALKCGPGPRSNEGDTFYSFGGNLPYPWIWWGNLNSDFRVKTPREEADAGLWVAQVAPDGVNTDVLLYWNKFG